MDINDIKFLAEMMKENDITKLDYESGDIKLKLEKSEEISHSNAQICEKEAISIAKKAEIKNYIEVKAPMIGVFYSSKAPGEPPYVDIGTNISKGDTLCLIEAMKIMNEILSEVNGTIVEVCVKNGQIVEYGQVLFKIK